MAPTIYTGKGNLNDDAEQGDTFESHHYPVSGSVVRFLYGVQDGSNYYYAEADESNGTLAFGKVSGGTETELASTGVTVPTDEWVSFTIEWTAGGDHTVELFDSGDSSLGSVGPTTDTEFADGGHGWAELGGVVSYHDYALFTSSGGQTAGSNFEVTIDGTNNPDEGGTANVDYTVENTGQQGDTQSLVLSIDGNTEDSEDINLAAGNNTSSTLSWSTSTGDTGDHTAQVTSENDSDTATVPVNVDLTVTIFSTNSPVAPGDDLDFTVDVENPTSTPITKEITLDVGGSQRDSNTLTIADNTTERFVLTWATTSGDVGTYTATVSSPNASATESVTVENQSPTGYSTDWTKSVSGILFGGGGRDGLVAAGDSDGFVYAYDLSGTLLWTRDHTGSSATRVTVGPNYVYASGGGTIERLDRADGSVDTSYSNPGYGPSEMHWANNNLYVGTNNPYVHKLDPADGTVIWTHTEDQNVVRDVRYGNGYVYSSSDRGTTAVDDSDGSFVWSYDPFGNRNGPLAWDKDKIMVLSDASNGDIAALNYSDGSENWYKSGVMGDEGEEAHAKNGNLYAGQAGNGLYSLAVSDGSLNFGNSGEEGSQGLYNESGGLYIVTIQSEVLGTSLTF